MNFENIFILPNVIGDRSRRRFGGIFIKIPKVTSAWSSLLDSYNQGIDPEAEPVQVSTCGGATTGMWNHVRRFHPHLMEEEAQDEQLERAHQEEPRVDLEGGGGEVRDLREDRLDAEWWREQVF